MRGSYRYQYLVMHVDMTFQDLRIFSKIKLRLLAKLQLNQLLSSRILFFVAKIIQKHHHSAVISIRRLRLFLVKLNHIHIFAYSTEWMTSQGVGTNSNTVDSIVCAPVFDFSSHFLIHHAIIIYAICKQLLFVKYG